MLGCVVEEEEAVAYKHAECIAHVHLWAELCVSVVVVAVVEVGLVGAEVHDGSQVDGVGCDFRSHLLCLLPLEFRLIEAVDVAFSIDYLHSDILVRLLEYGQTGYVAFGHVLGREFYCSVGWCVAC